MKPPCLVFEDDHLLVVNKPARLNSHSPSPYAGEGLYEWLRHRETRWANLAIIHRLDKETSGLILFSKTAVANKSLTEQFTTRRVKKKYVFLTDRETPAKRVTVRSAMVRAGERYLSRPMVAGADLAETSFCPREQFAGGGPGRLMEAEPLTGRTHQIRVHAADQGFPILGDALYGGSAWPRLCLHATRLTFQHPVSGGTLSFEAPPDFASDPGVALRSALIHPHLTDAFRLIHGASDGWPDWYVDKLGAYLLSQSPGPLRQEQQDRLTQLSQACSARGVYHKQTTRSVGEGHTLDLCPQLVFGSAAPEKFVVLENGLRFELSFSEGYSVGLFLDQRDNRRRLLTGRVTADFPMVEASKTAPNALNAFAYTCGFSAYAACANVRTTSLDLSKKYLEWGRANFLRNHLEPSEHEFIFGDVFEWLRRLGKKGRMFELILLDPPTFSRSKSFGPFRTEKDYGKLIAAALPLLKPRGVLFASCNTANWVAEAFLTTVKKSIEQAKREILQEHYFPQPPDFPISRNEPAYLKTFWVRLD